jgi:MOSC domain-containing protein YiiM
MSIALRSVNIGHLAPVAEGHAKRTGIHKHPVGGAVLCDRLGLVGDAIGNATHHGGPDQAVYLYSEADYAWWSNTLGCPCPPGLFGENLTIDDWWDAPRIGDRLTFGTVTLELSAPRIPCATLAARMGDPHFVQQFARAARCGAYARVITEGALEAGSTGQLERGNAEWPTVAELFAVWYRTPRERDTLLKYTKAPLAVRARETFVRWAASTDR